MFRYTQLLNKYFNYLLRTFMDFDASNKTTNKHAFYPVSYLIIYIFFF